MVEMLYSDRTRINSLLGRLKNIGMVSEKKNVAKFLNTVYEKKGKLLWPIAGKKNFISLPV